MQFRPGVLMSDSEFGRTPSSVFEWALAGASLAAVVVVFFVSPETGWTLHPAADYIGYMALIVLFGEVALEVLRGRQSTDGSDDETDQTTRER